MSRFRKQENPENMIVGSFSNVTSDTWTDGQAPAAKQGRQGEQSSRSKAARLGSWGRRGAGAGGVGSRLRWKTISKTEALSGRKAQKP